MMKIYSILAVLALSLPFQLRAEVHWFESHELVQTTDQNELKSLCQAKARMLNDHYFKLTGNDLAQLSCYDVSGYVNHKSTSVHFMFQLDDGLAPRTWAPHPTYLAFTGSSFDPTPRPSFGPFNTLAECVQSLPSQRQLYSSYNGKLLLASCIQTKHFGSSLGHSYAIAFWAMEKPHKNLFVSSLGAWGNRSMEPLKKLATSLIHEVSGHVVYQNSSYEYIWYYADYPVGIDLNRLAEYTGADSAELCRSELERAHHVFSNIGEGHYRLYCDIKAEGTYLSARLLVLVDRLTHYEEVMINDYSPKEGYLSFEACQRDRPRVESVMGRGRKIYGAFCTQKFNQSSPRFELNILSKNIFY